MRGPAGRRVRALNVLSRLREEEVNRVTGELRRLQGQIAELAAERGRLEAGLAENAHVDTLEGSFFLARYARDVRSRLLGLDRRVAEITPLCTALEERIRDLYVEAKTYDSLEVRIRAAAVRDRARREAEALEEAHLIRMTARALRGASRS
ncbi:MAG: hypothetical protein KC466_00450 [Myxococcales bacterium]|nr:hypothetical protein [Myxococcales bacterium]